LRLTRSITALSLALTLAVSGQLSCFADITAPSGSVAANTHAHVSAIQAHLSTRIEAHSGLEAYDDSPLGEKTPLVLIHGIASYQSDNFHWENFLHYATKKPDFQSKYKIYIYHYDSTHSVPTLSKELQTTLKGFIGALNGRSIKILAYSEGGLLTRNAIQDPYLDAHTTEVLTIATPFHGSPLANPHWIQQQVKTESAFNLVRIGQKIAYRITGRKYPTFQQDFHWDNFDGAIPMADYVKNNGPMVQTSYTLAKKSHFVTYGSYFGMDVDSSALQKELGLQGTLPKERLQMSNLFRKNVMFSLIRNNIGHLPLANLKNKPADKSAANTSIPEPILTLEAKVKEVLPQTPISVSAQPISLAMVQTNKALAPISNALSAVAEKTAKLSIAEPVSMMMFNDGISPISSTLWLGRYTQCVNGSSIPVERLWSTLKSLKGSGQARLFPGLDHRNWMDGTTRTGQETIPDLLNPNEPPRTVFEWIVYDLMS